MGVVWLPGTSGLRPVWPAGQGAPRIGSAAVDEPVIARAAMAAGGWSGRPGGLAHHAPLRTRVYR